MIKAIITDDEPRSVETLRKLLELHCPSVQIVAECSNVTSARKLIAEYQPDLLFLDIAMPGKSGFDLLDELDDIHFDIIFVTAHNEFMLQAFRFSAIDYILKPIDEELLIMAVNRVKKKIKTARNMMAIEAFKYNLKQVQHPQDMKLCIPHTKGFSLVVLSDIIYCMANNTYTTFFLANGQSLVSSKSIIDFELLLQDSSFCRIHKSYLVNMQHIKEYLKGEGGTVIMSNNKELEVSRRKKEHFLESVKGYYKYT
ncbi:LytR/AlgR family response regulator transcription factor [Chitinophaga niastensis]|nr:response regulator [Chitinophaga niastensis]